MQGAGDEEGQMGRAPGLHGQDRRTALRLASLLAYFKREEDRSAMTKCQTEQRN